MKETYPPAEIILLTRGGGTPEKMEYMHVQPAVVCKTYH
jgi:hypothetical protein